MKGLFVLMKSGIIISGIVAASLFIGGCGSKSNLNNPPDSGNLSAPAPSSPANGSTNQAASITLTWETVTGATAYDVQVSTVATFATVVSNQTGLTASSASVGGLASSTTYYWHVNATNAEGSSVWSSEWSFTTSGSTTTAVPGAPVLVSPANGATGQSVAPFLSWSSGSGGMAASYGVEVSTSANFGSLIVNQSGVTASGITLSGFSNSKTYYWRVNAANANGTSAWASAWSFTTIAAGTTINIQDSIATIITTAQLDTLQKLGMLIYSGNMPPTISGDYYASSFMLVKTNSNSLSMTFPFAQSFQIGQTNSCNVSFNVYNGAGLYQSTGFITGSGNNFTIYCKGGGGSGTYAYTTIGIISGILTTSGISNCYFGFIAISGPLPITIGSALVMQDNNITKVGTFPYSPQKIINN